MHTRMINVTNCLCPGLLPMIDVFLFDSKERMYEGSLQPSF